MHRGKNLRRMTGRLIPSRRHAYYSDGAKSTLAQRTVCGVWASWIGSGVLG